MNPAKLNANIISSTRNFNKNQSYSCWGAKEAEIKLHLSAANGGYDIALPLLFLPFGKLILDVFGH
jgi:hypothetical protein